MWKRPAGMAVFLAALVGAAIVYYRNRAEPLFAQVVFGPEARLSIWFILAGDTIYLDRRAGDTPQRVEPFPEGGIELADPDGPTRYLLTKVGPIYSRQAVRRGRQQLLAFDVAIRGPVEYEQCGAVAMAPRPERAGIAHVHGPLTVTPDTHPDVPPLRFVLGGKPTDLRAVVTTYHRNGASGVAVRSENAARNGPAFAPQVAPVVDVDFPSRAPGGPPVRRRFSLDQLC